MQDPPLVIEEPPKGVRGRARAVLDGRKMIIAIVLALVEVIAFLVWRPSVILMTLLAALVLALTVWGAMRLRAGLGRDLLMIVAGAQALVIGIPLAVGFSVVIGLIVGLVLIAGLVALAFASRK